MNSVGDTLAGGLPHSEIPGSTIARISPGLIAACHALHRLSVPRHPPDALKTLDPRRRSSRRRNKTRHSQGQETPQPGITGCKTSALIATLCFSSMKTLYLKGGCTLPKTTGKPPAAPSERGTRLGHTSLFTLSKNTPTMQAHRRRTVSSTIVLRGHRDCGSVPGPPFRGILRMPLAGYVFTP